MFRVLLLCLCNLLCFTFPTLAEPLELYLDADFSKSKAASSSIELGLRTALAEVDHRLGGVEVRLVPKDHRSNVKRSFRHMQTFRESENALALIGGMQSPPYLAHRDYLNENGLLTLLTWSAAGPITRAAAGQENWIFRLSVDDAKSGSFLVDAAVKQGKCEKVALLLMDTGWGHANRQPLIDALEAWDRSPALVELFPSAIGDAAAGTLADMVAEHRADCAILLANWDNGATMVNALNEHAPELQIFSHWGITGGSFPEVVSHAVRQQHNLSVLQTCGLERETPDNTVLQHALMQAFPDAPQLSSVAAPAGFVHGYDLMRILIAAADRAAQTDDWAGDITQKRRSIRTALENLETPIEGILKTYAHPFWDYTPNRPDAHEALGPSDLCLARFDENGALEDIR